MAIPQRVEKRNVKRSLPLAGAALLLWMVQGCALDTIPYLFRLAVNQANLLSQRRPIGAVLKDPKAVLDPKARKRLGLVAEVREFSRRIGLTPGGAYTQYAPVRLEVFVVTAAERTRLKRRTWWWPILGTVPYKGFFTKAGAADEARKLRAQSLDTHVRTVRAYSTLGWFDDPVVPAILKGGLGPFVGVLIHESVHATFFRKGNAPFNEQAAVLVEREGAKRFLREKFGRDSKAIGRYQRRLAKGERFLETLDGLHAELSRLYRSRRTDAEKLSRRKDIFGKFLAAHPAIARRLRRDEKSTGLRTELNNAYLLSYRLYFANRDRMRRIFDRIGRDLPKMVSLIKRAAEAEGDPFEALERLAGNLRAKPSPVGRANPSPPPPTFLLAGDAESSAPARNRGGPRRSGSSGVRPADAQFSNSDFTFNLSAMNVA